MKPKTRADCIDGPRPCRWITCRHHLVTIRKRDTEAECLARAESMSETCSLDVAARGGTTHQEIADILGLCRERVRQNEESALNKLRSANVLTSGKDLQHLVKKVALRRVKRAPRDMETGARFGMVTVVGPGAPYSNGQPRVLCKCDCGKEKLIATNSLRRGLTKSCGCARNKGNMIDEAGNKYGSLLVLRKSDRCANTGALWMCKCGCGNEIEVAGLALRRGTWTCCGCQKRKVA